MMQAFALISVPRDTYSRRSHSTSWY